MKLPPNRFKAALARGDTVLHGLWLGLPDSSVAELAADSGFDWLLIDHEHGPFELRDILHHLQTIAAYDSAAVVRPAVDDPALLKKLLDLGAQNLLVPMVDSAAQAREVVRAVRYPPGGYRGLGTSLARAARWGRTTDYLERANEELCILLQVESTEAIDNLDGILEVDGIDGVFIGPSDLSASMGHPGQAGHPEVREVICGALRRIRGAGKAAGLLCLDPVLARQYVGQGANFVGVGVDTLLLAQEMRRLALACRGPDSAAGDASAGS